MFNFSSLKFLFFLIKIYKIVYKGGFPESTTGVARSSSSI
jgi:hypothetical protein